MRPVQAALALALAALLAFTSLSLAVARGQPGPAGVMVICTGAGLQAIEVDAEGNPVGPVHPCPDGLAALAALAAAAPDVPERALVTGRVALLTPVRMPGGLPGPEPRSRGPPGAAG